MIRIHRRDDFWIDSVKVSPMIGESISAAKKQASENSYLYVLGKENLKWDALVATVPSPFFGR